MKNVLLALSTLLTLFFTACQTNNPEYQAENDLDKEIMAVHDEVMPKMSEINRLAREMKKMVGPESKLDEGTKSYASQALQLLEKADDGMMDWMQLYNPPSKMRDKLSHEEIMQYLQKEKAKIELVKKMMNESIENGKQTLANFENAQ